MSSGKGSPFTAAIAALGAAGLFSVFWLFLGLPLGWSAGAGVAGYAALWFMLNGSGKKKDESEKPIEMVFIDEELAKKTVAVGRAAAAALAKNGSELGRGHPLSRRVNRLVELIEAVASDVEADPKDAPAAHSFLSYQGEAAARLIRLAIDLERRGGSESQIAEARSRLERTFDLLISAFESHLARLQEDNLSELQSELDVLEESLAADYQFAARLEEPLRPEEQARLGEPAKSNLPPEHIPDVKEASRKK